MSRANDLARSALYGAMGHLGIRKLSDEAVDSVADRIDADLQAAVARAVEERHLEWLKRLGYETCLGATPLETDEDWEVAISVAPFVEDLQARAKAEGVAEGLRAAAKHVPIMGDWGSKESEMIVGCDGCGWRRNLKEPGGVAQWQAHLLALAPAEIAAEQDRREKLARAEARLEEWMNAPMGAWPDQTSYPQEWGNELRQHQQNRIFALQAELASLRAPAEPPKEKP